MRQLPSPLRGEAGQGKYGQAALAGCSRPTARGPTRQKLTKVPPRCLSAELNRKPGSSALPVAGRLRPESGAASRYPAHFDRCADIRHAAKHTGSPGRLKLPSSRPTAATYDGTRMTAASAIAERPVPSYRFSSADKPTSGTDKSARSSADINNKKLTSRSSCFVGSRWPGSSRKWRDFSACGLLCSCSSLWDEELCPCRDVATRPWGPDEGGQAIPGFARCVFRS